MPCRGASPLSVTDEIRRRLCLLGASRRTRSRVFRSDRPCDWRATGMTDPRTREAFTEDGAWEYIAQLITDGIEIEVIDLDIPAGKKGYVMNLPSHDPQIPIYVKLQLSGDCVIGRSFHYSTRPVSKIGGANDE
jgi:hypothetical protein